MKMLLGVGILFGLVFIAYLNRHNNIGPAIMMALVFPYRIGRNGQFRPQRLVRQLILYPER